MADKCGPQEKKKQMFKDTRNQKKEVAKKKKIRRGASKGSVNGRFEKTRPEKKGTNNEKKLRLNGGQLEPDHALGPTRSLADRKENRRRGPKASPNNLEDRETANQTGRSTARRKKVELGR